MIVRRHRISHAVCLTATATTLFASAALVPVFSAVPTASAELVLVQAPSTTQPVQPAAGVPFSAEKLASLLPTSVYFQGRSASLQIRNAAGASLANGAIVWASLVDTSGYSSGVQEKYQFYLVTEGPLRIGTSQLAPGAYGGGFVGDNFILMDLGGHTIAEGPVQVDNALPRPRPLQMLPLSQNSVRLFLGRRWVTLQSASH